MNDLAVRAGAPARRNAVCDVAIVWSGGGGQRRLLARALCACLFLALLSLPVRSQPQAPSALIEQCARTADEDAAGLEELEAACPGLSAALDAIEAMGWLSDTQREGLTTAGLDDFVRLDERYRNSAPAASPDPGALAPILASLQEPPRQGPPGLMERFKEWLRSLVEREISENSWLERWLTRIEVSRGTMLAILSALALVVVVSALVIVSNELRVAGVFGRGGRRTRAAHARGAGSSGTSTLTLADVDAAPLHERPSLLLRLLLATLAKGGRIRSERSLTHREVIARATLDDATQRESFAQVASAAEGIVYGGRSFEREELDRVLEGGRVLQAQLDKSP